MVTKGEEEEVVGEEIMAEVVEGETGEKTMVVVVEDMEETMVMMKLTVITVIVTGAEVCMTRWWVVRDRTTRLTNS